MTKPIDLHYWPTPNGWKITIALEEMGLPYEVKLVNIGQGEQFAPGFQAISPNGRMPAIVDPEGDDGEPLSIFESGAILQHLGAEFESVDVLQDQAIRQGIKAYSDWPTIPQLYVDGEFVGGSDIMMEMYESGELADLLKADAKAN